MISIWAYDTHVEQLFEKMSRIHRALSEAGIEYRIVGGMAVFLQVNERDPDAARLTRDIDIAVDPADLDKIKAAAAHHGFRYRHSAGVDMLVDANEPARSAIHLVFIGRKARPEYLEAVPGFSAPTIAVQGVLLAPVADLVRMKLTSFRLKDQVHIQDMDSVGLITPDIEMSLPEPLKERLAQVRASR